jgi:carbon storage regulator CsrA
MLVLSRKTQESVVVGDPAGGPEQTVMVTVLRIGRDKVRLGFEVAGDIPVHRWEVWQAIRSRGVSDGPPPDPAPWSAQ